jgi:hypothetical protein
MNRFARTAIIAGLAACTMLVAVASPAIADDTATTTKIKSEITARIDLRLGALSRFEARIGTAKNLTSDHKSTLSNLIAQDRSGLTDLKAKVAGETTATALRADAKSMVDDYRIYILVGPKVRLTVASDTEAAAIARLGTAYTKLTDLVAQAKAAGKDTAAAEQDLADMKTAMDKATSAIDGQAATLLAIQPGPDGAGIRSQVLTVRAALATGRASLATALAKAKHVRDFLKSAK